MDVVSVAAVVVERNKVRNVTSATSYLMTKRLSPFVVGTYFVSTFIPRRKHIRAF